MAKYYGKIGFYIERKTAPGIWTQKIIEREAFGDIIKMNKKTENAGQANDDINITNQISFIADPFAMDNFAKIKYATYMGTKWAVTSAGTDFPRIILNLGGIYHENEQAQSPCNPGEYNR